MQRPQFLDQRREVSLGARGANEDDSVELCKSLIVNSSKGFTRPSFLGVSARL